MSIIRASVKSPGKSERCKQCHYLCWGGTYTYPKLSGRFFRERGGGGAVPPGAGSGCPDPDRRGGEGPRWRAELLGKV